MRQLLGILIMVALLPIQRAAAFNVDQTRPTVALSAPFDTVPHIIQDVLSFILVIAGILFLVLFFVGGIRYLAGAGDPKQTGDAKRLLVDAVVGLILTLAAYAISTFIYGYLTGRNVGHNGASTSTGASISNLPPPTASTFATGASISGLPTPSGEGGFGTTPLPKPSSSATVTASPGSLPQPTTGRPVSSTTDASTTATASPPPGQFPQP